jgi:Phospholipid-translocating ATPase N-terminal
MIGDSNVIGSRESINLQNMETRHLDIYKVYNYKRDGIRPFKNNEIHTSKYNVLTFLPKNLFYQFSKMSNLYFLTMSLLEVFSSLIYSVACERNL